MLPKLSHRFNGIPIKMSIAYLADLEQTIPEFIWNQKRKRTTKGILGKQAQRRSNHNPI